VSLFELPTEPITLLWNGKQGYNNAAFRLIPGGQTDEATLAAADAAGWRKVHLYGQTIYVCPKCRPARTSYEWERRLIGRSPTAEALQEMVNRIEQERE
jgi:hypothetical protein